MNLREIIEKHWNYNNHLYCIATPDIIVTVKKLMEFFQDKAIEQSMVHCSFYNYDKPSFTKINKGILEAIITEKSIIIITTTEYHKYCHYLNKWKGYVFILAFSVHELVKIENSICINLNIELNITDFANQILEDTKLNQLSLSTNSLYKYFDNNNWEVHLNQIESALITGSLDMNYIKEHHVFLHYFMEELIINTLLYDESQTILEKIDSRITPSKSLLLCSLYPKLMNSIFPDKKVLFCNYMFNMIRYIAQ